MLSLLFLTLPVGLLCPLAFHVFPLSILAGLGPPLVYMIGRASHTPPLIERLKLLPLLTITGFGLCLSTSIAVFQGLFGTGDAVFVSTPKLNISNTSAQRTAIDHDYISPISPVVWIELLLGVYALITGIVLVPLIGWEIFPWMMVYMLGFFYIGGLNLIQYRDRYVGGTARKINVT